MIDGFRRTLEEFDGNAKIAGRSATENLPQQVAMA